MNRRILPAVLVTPSLWLLLAQQPTALQLPAVFGDHMVLQQRTEVPVWGAAPAGAAVVVRGSWSDRVTTGSAGADGRFTLRLTTPAAGGPFTVTVAAGDSSRTLQDVLVGEVWLGSGQSNMEWTVRESRNADQEALAADHPQLRLFTVEHRWTAAPAADVRGEWRVCTPDTVRNFSAVGYFFGRDLQQRLQVPVGVVCSAVGGTVCEAWTSSEGLSTFPEFGAVLQELAAARASEATVTLTERRAAWWQTVAGKDPTVAGRTPDAAAFDDHDWPTVVMPHLWSGDDFKDFDGVAWYRRQLTLPAGMVGKDLLLELGPIDDMDTVFVDGQKVGGSEAPGGWNQARSYPLAAASVHAQMTIAVRVVDTGGEGGFTGAPAALRLRAANGAGEVPLAGEWRHQRGSALADLPAFPAELVSHPNIASVLWNAMIAPLVPFAFSGVIWYQGESNRDRSEQYARLFPAMIRDWRRAFGRELPFLFVQIAPFDYDPETGQTPLLRQAQAAALQLPHTGMVVTMDIGEPGNIHPQDKQTVGERLCLQALHKVHGRDLVCDGPRFASLRREAGGVRVVFTGTEGGLVAVGGAPNWFEVAGLDGRFVTAHASIDGDTVLLSADGVGEPATVRFAWAAAAEPNLKNGAGLPAWPFLASW